MLLILYPHIICIYMYWCFSRLPTCFCWYKCSTFINFPNLLAIYDELRPQIYLFIDNTGTGAAPLGHPGQLGAYPLVMTNSLLWYRWPIYRWFTHYTWWFSIVMLVYQRVRSLVIYGEYVEVSAAPGQEIGTVPGENGQGTSVLVPRKNHRFFRRIFH